MTEEERIKRNEAIARFLGWMPGDSNGTPGWFPGDDSDLFFVESLDFHRDWNSLSPAIEKIIVQVGVETHCIYDEDGWQYTLSPFHYASYAFAPVRGFGTYMIEAAWMAVSSYCLTFENPAPDEK